VADPIYRRIAEQLREQIESGELVPGAQLPTELELRERFNASRNTIRDAVKSLIALGLVETRPGQGTFVTERIEPFVTTLSADPKTGLGGGEGVTYQDEGRAQQRVATATDPRVEIQLAAGVVPVLLKIPEGAQVVSRHQQRLIDNTPWSLQTSFYPMKFVTAGGATRLLEASSIENGTVKYIEETVHLKQLGYRDWITVRSPDTNETAFFRLPGDGRVGVFEILRTAFDQDLNPMRLTITVFPTDRNQFIVNVGELPGG